MIAFHGLSGTMCKRRSAVDNTSRAYDHARDVAVKRTKLLGEHEHGSQEAAAQSIERQAEGCALNLLLFRRRLQFGMLLFMRQVQAICVAVGCWPCHAVAIRQATVMPD